MTPPRRRRLGTTGRFLVAAGVGLVGLVGILGWALSSVEVPEEPELVVDRPLEARDLASVRAAASELAAIDVGVRPVVSSWPCAVDSGSASQPSSDVSWRPTKAVPFDDLEAKVVAALVARGWSVPPRPVTSAERWRVGLGTLTGDLYGEASSSIPGIVPSVSIALRVEGSEPCSLR